MLPPAQAVSRSVYTTWNTNADSRRRQQEAGRSFGLVAT